jgi:hypothetical protein
MTTDSRAVRLVLGALVTIIIVSLMFTLVQP